MYKEVSFDPSCMGSMEYYCLVRQHFGYDHGRYISADAKEWAKEAIKSVKQSGLQPVKQKSIKNYLNKLAMSKGRDAFHLTADRQGIVKNTWLTWHNTQIGLRPFSFAVSESSEIECIGIDDINDGCDDWYLSRSISIDRHAKNIVDAVMPLIKISKTITIIDPYFILADNRTLIELMSACQLYGVTDITVVTSMETLSASQLYNKYYQNINTKNISFRWIKAPDKFFHDRYFITDVGAIRSGQGFMEGDIKGSHADKANLNIIGKDEADRTLNGLSCLINKGEKLRY